MRIAALLFVLLSILFLMPIASASTEKWQALTGGYIYSSPELFGKNVIFGSHDQSVYSFDVETGRLITAFATSGPVDSDPAIHGSVVYIGSGDGYLYSLDAAKLEQRWRSSAKTGGIWRSRPLLANGRVYIGSIDGKLYAFKEANGALNWTFQTGDGINSAPAYANGVVYVASSDGSLYALDASTGALKWSTPLNGLWLSSPVPSDNGRLYIGSTSGIVYSLDITSGGQPTTAWTFPTGGAIYATPTILDDILVVGSADHSLYGINLITGERAWRFDTNGSIYAQAAYAKNRFGSFTVYAGSTDGNVYAIDAENGFLRWTFHLGEWIAARPLPAGAILAVPSYDNRLHGLSTLSCTFTNPVDDGTVGSQQIEVQGTAWSDVEVSAVNVRANGGPWVRATGTEAWAVGVQASNSQGDVLLECQTISQSGEEQPPYNSILVNLQPGAVSLGKVMSAEYPREELQYGSEVRITLKGRDGFPIAGARATWPGGSATSDRNGVLLAHADVQGEMAIIVKASGYEDKRVVLKVAPNYTVFIIAGAILLVGIYYLLVYRRRPRQKES